MANDKADAIKAAVAATAPASIPHTPRKLPNSQFRSAEVVQPQWVAVPDGQTSFDDVLKREYWSHVASRLEPDALIYVKPERRDYFALLIVDQVGPNWASVEVLHKVDRGESAPTTRTDEFDVRWVSPTVRYCVVRKSDGQRVSENHAKEGDARRWLAENEARLANAA